ncbi:MAG: hypothetical protein JRH10_03635 [Deltaproteobacteria bacterium]|nr:hypothetical protein [Deltaproteobacteria bacterium]MBW2444681.1 hypothetical protein [Deltaproteobacteria bacterium]
MPGIGRHRMHRFAAVVRGARALRTSARGSGLVGLLLALSCVGPGAGPELSPGAHFAAGGPIFRALTAGLSGLDGTPLGRRAAESAERLAGCDSIVGHAADGDLQALFDSLACGAPSAALAEARGDSELLWVAPLDERQRWFVTGSRAANGLVLEARLDPPGLSEGRALLAPSAEDAGPPVLASGEALIHARVRPVGGLDLAKLVPEGSQGDRLFRMKSALFGSTVLGGVWEIAVYMPEPGEPLPPMALALDVRRRDAALRAMEGFVHDLADTWPVHPTPARFGGPVPSEGECLFDLRILPGFAPCYVATERALIVGWNPASLERALAGSEARTEGPSRLGLRFDRLGEADRRLRATRGVAAAATSRAWGWQRLEIGPTDEGNAWRIQLVDAEPTDVAAESTHVVMESTRVAAEPTQ